MGVEGRGCHPGSPPPSVIAAPMQGVRGQLTPRLLSLQHRGKLFPAQKDVCGHRVYASQCSSLSSSLLSCTKGCPCSCTPVSWDTSFQAAEAPVWTLLPPDPDYDFGETPRSKTRLGRGDERHAHRLHHAQVQKRRVSRGPAHLLELLATLFLLSGSTGSVRIKQVPCLVLDGKWT